MALGIRSVEDVGVLYPQKLALTFPTSGGRSVGIVCSRTQSTEFFIQFLSLRLCFYFIFIFIFTSVRAAIEQLVERLIAGLNEESELRVFRDKNINFSISSRPTLGLTQPPIQLVFGGSLREGKTTGGGGGG
jgi:hypothetical protein